MSVPSIVTGPLRWVAGDDIILTITPDEDTFAGSTDWMKTLASPMCTIRTGESNSSKLLASTNTPAGSDPGGLLLGGHTFPGGGGLVVPPTDFTVPILTIVAPAAVTTAVGVGVGEERWIAIGALVAGVQETIMPPTKLTILPRWRP